MAVHGRLQFIQTHTLKMAAEMIATDTHTHTQESSWAALYILKFGWHHHLVTKKKDMSLVITKPFLVSTRSFLLLTWSFLVIPTSLVWNAWKWCNIISPNECSTTVSTSSTPPLLNFWAVLQVNNPLHVNTHPSIHFLSFSGLSLGSTRENTFSIRSPLLRLESKESVSYSTSS